MIVVFALHPTHPSPDVLAIGVDGARGGWVAAVLRASSKSARNAPAWETELLPLAEIDELAELRSASASRATVAIDIPIGLPEEIRYRACDREARKALPGRASCVFAPPPRGLLDADRSYEDVQRWVEKKRESNPDALGLSRQSAALIPKVGEVDRWLRDDPTRSEWLVECHPELAFVRLNSGQPAPPKTSGAGAIRRLRLLRTLFADIEDRIADSSLPKTDLTDVLDAYGALSVALRCARGEEQYLGDGERDGEGLPMRIAM